jgi:Ca2+-binding EF-hand superfamily protein
MVSSIGSMGGVSSSYISQMQEKMFKTMDTDGDGSITAKEFVSNRPKEVSEEQAEEMWSKLDTEYTGSLTASEFLSAMENLGPPPGPPPGGSKYGSQSLGDLFSKIDTDGDGSVTEKEFVSNRPEKVSEDQAKEMWSKLDTEDTGSLTASEFLSAMENLGPPPGPPPGEFGDQEDPGVLSSIASSSTQISSGSSTTATDDLVQALMAAITKYASTMEQSGSSSVGRSVATSSLVNVA